MIMLVLMWVSVILLFQSFTYVSSDVLCYAFSRWIIVDTTRNANNILKSVNTLFLFATPRIYQTLVVFWKQLLHFFAAINSYHEQFQSFPL